MKNTRQHFWKTWKMKNNGLRLKSYEDGTEDNPRWTCVLEETGRVLKMCVFQVRITTNS